MRAHKRLIIAGELLGVLVLLCFSPVNAITVPVRQEDDAIASIKAIVINGEKKDQTDTGVEIRRANKRLEQRVQSGTRLYENDEVRTLNGAQVIITFASKEAHGEILVDENSLIRISPEYTYFGRILAKVRGYFATRTKYVKLGVKGTEFELDVQSFDRTKLIVLEGAVEVLNDTSASDKKLDTHVDTGPHNNATPLLQSLIINERTEFKFVKDALGTNRPQKITDSRLMTVLEWSNKVFLSGQPSFPPPGFIPHYASREGRSEQFVKARFDTLRYKQSSSYKVLGDIYNDWGEGFNAVDAYSDALNGDRNFENNSAFLTDVSEAYRVLGELSLAKEKITKALSIDQELPAALNTLGNIYFDEATVARKARHIDYAWNVLGKADDAYQQAFASLTRQQGRPVPKVAIPITFDHVGPYKILLPTSPQGGVDLHIIAKAIAQFNIGQANLGLGSIALEKGLTEEAIKYFGLAIKAFQYAKSLYPQYPYIAKGLDASIKGLTDILTRKSKLIRELISTCGYGVVVSSACRDFLDGAVEQFGQKSNLGLIVQGFVGTDESEVDAVKMVEDVEVRVKSYLQTKTSARYNVTTVISDAKGVTRSEYSANRKSFVVLWLVPLCDEKACMTSSSQLTRFFREYRREHLLIQTLSKSSSKDFQRLVSSEMRKSEWSNRIRIVSFGRTLVGDVNNYISVLDANLYEYESGNGVLRVNNEVLRGIAKELLDDGKQTLLVRIYTHNIPGSADKENISKNWIKSLYDQLIAYAVNPEQLKFVVTNTPPSQSMANKRPPPGMPNKPAPPGMPNSKRSSSNDEREATKSESNFVVFQIVQEEK